MNKDLRPIQFLDETFPCGWEIRKWWDYYFVVVKIGCTCYDGVGGRLSEAITKAAMNAFREQR